MRDSFRRFALPVTILCAAFGVAVSLLFMLPGTQAADLPTSVTITVCGDGIVSVGEVCDDGAGFNVGGYGSTTAERHCNADCMSFDPYCGDGILQARFTEECDDGNATSGDLCSNLCRTETPAPPGGNGLPTVGSVPQQSGTPGAISGLTPTKVVLRGRAFPNARVQVLLDGKELGTVNADANADFVFSSTEVMPGTASFGFRATDGAGNTSSASSVVFDVLQGAVTTVANVFVPPTLVLSTVKFEPGEPLTLSGLTVPKAKVTTKISAAGAGTFTADADAAGKWALKVDTESFPNGSHTAKAYFQMSDTVKSGFGRSVAFVVGTDTSGGSCGAPDMNSDKKVNLVDFSIFLISWNTTEQKADFNCDEKVNLADFSIMLFEWTG